MTQSGDRELAATVEKDMRLWLERAVIALNLCPFAKAVHVRGQIHYAISDATDRHVLLRHLSRELAELAALDPAVRDTTLLMAPACLADFLDFNDFLVLADKMLVDLALDGDIQIASFHPNFQFANTVPDDITNYTNRAPYPCLHLLRESSVDRAVAAFPHAEAIFERNMRTMEQLGSEGWAALGVRRTGPVSGYVALDPDPHGKISS